MFSIIRSWCGVLDYFIWWSYSSSRYGTQIVLLKTTQKVRKYKLSIAPTVEEMKKFAFSFDEELQS